MSNEETAWQKASPDLEACGLILRIVVCLYPSFQIHTTYVEQLANPISFVSRVRKCQETVL